jgi:hypothetical protein
LSRVGVIRTAGIVGNGSDIAPVVVHIHHDNKFLCCQTRIHFGLTAFQRKSVALALENAVHHYLEVSYSEYSQAVYLIGNTSRKDERANL